MNKHLIFLLFILLFTLGQNQPEIKMLSGQVSQCSSGNSMGRIDYKIKYSFSSATDLTSYFMLFLSDGSSEKCPSICQLYYNSTEESTDDDSKKGTESDDEEGNNTESDNEEGKSTESDNKKEKAQKVITKKEKAQKVITKKEKTQKVMTKKEKTQKVMTKKEIKQIILKSTFYLKN